MLSCFYADGDPLPFRCFPHGIFKRESFMFFLQFHENFCLKALILLCPNQQKGFHGVNGAGVGSSGSALSLMRLTLRVYALRTHSDL